MKSIVAYCVLTAAQYNGVEKWSKRTQKVFERETNYNCNSALEEVLFLFKDKKQPSWQYEIDSKNKNFVIAKNIDTGDIDYIFVIGFVKSNQQRYQIKNRVDYKLSIMLNSESDILQKLQSVSNRQGYIKQLIRADIEKNSI